MAKNLLTIDNTALSYAGKVIPIRSIAYLEKSRVRRSYEPTVPVAVAAAVIVGILAQAWASAAVAGVLAGLVTVLIIAASPRKHALILQTTAGDAPRLFETRDEDFLDRLIEELTLRLESGGKLPPMVVNLQAKRINMGDTFKNISGSTIVNRAMVAESFNTVSRKYDQETAEAIQRIAEFIETSGNTTAAELFEGFNQEIISDNPRKSVLRNLWDGLQRELPGIKDLADVVVRIASIVG